MGLFTKLKLEQIDQAAKNSKKLVDIKPKVNTRSITAKLDEISAKVQEHFKDSKAILITSENELHEYISKMIDAKYGSIDTETTGLDKIRDTIVGVSLYYKGGVECYIPLKHRVPIFEDPYPNQLTYEIVGRELQRLVDAKVHLVFANADFDITMIYKDLKVDLLDVCWYDVILAWRCIKEDERDNSLKGLYTKYVLHGTMDRMKFSDFFSPELFPYCKPEIAKLYAAADALYTFDLCLWQLPYIQKDNPKCKKRKLEAISDLIWNIEFPLIRVCQMMHRRGIYLESSVSDMLRIKYNKILDKENKKLREMLNDVLNDPRYSSSAKRPFVTIDEFNFNSTPHVKWLCYNWLKLDGGKKQETSKEVLSTFNVPIIDQILKCRSLVTLISTFVDKLPDNVADDHRIHCTFRSVGAATGRMSSADPKSAYWGLKIKLIQGRATA